MTQIDKWSILAGLRFGLASIVAIKHLDEYTGLGWLHWISAFGTFEAILGFLLISGYSIGVSYAKEPGGFLWRRIQRLYPIYLTAMAATCLTFALQKYPQPSPLTVIINLLFLNQLVLKTSLVGPAWSLSLEFWLYCLTLGLMRLSQSVLRMLVYGSFLCFLVYEMLRTLRQMPYYSGVGYGANLIFLSFIWLAGLRLARSKPGEKNVLGDVGLIFTVYLAFTAMVKLGSRCKHHEVSSFFSQDLILFAMQAATLLSVYLIFKHLVIPRRAAPHRSKLLRFLGDVSYPLYLLHASVYCVIAWFGSKLSFMSKMPVLYYVTAVLVSALAYWSLDFYSRRQHQKVGTT